MARGARAQLQSVAASRVACHTTCPGLSSSWTWSQPFLFSVVAASTSLAPIIDRSGSAPPRRAACKRHSSRGTRAGCSRENGGGTLHGELEGCKGWIFAGCKELAFCKTLASLGRVCRARAHPVARAFEHTRALRLASRVRSLVSLSSSIASALSQRSAICSPSSLQCSPAAGISYGPQG